MQADCSKAGAAALRPTARGRWPAKALALALATLLALHPLAALAQGTPPAAPASPGAAGPSLRDQQRTEAEAAWNAALATATRGPAGVPLLDQARMALPAGMIFVPKAEATRLLRAWGNHPGPSLVGLVTTPVASDPWVVTINYTAEGYVRDDEAAKLDAGEVLSNLREGQEEANKDRVSRGFPELRLLGWTQPPAYDPATHRLTWSLRVKTADEGDEDASINFNTRALGREGYFSLNLVTEQNRIATDSQVSAQLLSGLEYVPGKRYADFNAGTDRVAEYGLAALIGVAAKKLGLFALLAAFFAKFAKVAILAVIGLGAAVSRLFRRAPRA